MPYLPPEWHPQSAVQLTWPHEKTDWKDCLQEAIDCFTSIAREIVKRELLLIVAPDTEKVRAHLLSSGISDTNVRFFQCPTNDTWARDHAPITLLPSTEATADAHILDFRFNGWGGKFPADLDTRITGRLMDAKLLHGYHEDHNDFILEGGSIDSDGKGTIMTTNLCVLNPNRNKHLNRYEIEAELKRRLHVERIFWLKSFFIPGDDTDGHIDILARFAPNDTILYIADQGIKDELAYCRTRDNRPYRLLELPACDVWEGRRRLPATYANFLVINGAVLYPTYDEPDTDAEAGRVIAQAFPDREIIPIDCQVLVRQNGSLHCVTMQYPEHVVS